MRVQAKRILRALTSGDMCQTQDGITIIRNRIQNCIYSKMEPFAQTRRSAVKLASKLTNSAIQMER